MAEVIAPAICPTCGQQLMGADRALREEVRDAVFASERTQVELAAALGVSEKHLSQTLNGRSGLTLKFAEQVLALLGRRLTIGTEIVGGGTDA